MKTFKNLLNEKTYAVYVMGYCNFTKISFFAYMPAINYYRYF